MPLNPKPVNRREAMRGIGAAGMMLASSCAQNPTARDARRRPNFIVIMCDDMGISDIGCHGSEISTPNLDRLAREGTRCTSFYNTARCCPSRASILTGLYSHQAGIGHMVQDRGFPAYQGYLNDRCATVAETLGSTGYRTLMSGKWHVGEERPHWPLDRGFDDYYGLISGACNYFQLDPGRRFARNNTSITDLGEDFYMTDATTDHAVWQLDRYGRGDKPFYQYVAYTAPHWPLHAWPEDIERYRGRYRGGWDRLRRERYARMVEMDLIDPDWKISPRDPTVPAWEDAEHHDWQAMRMAVYAAQIDCMDRGIGKILTKLKEIGEEENTLILFMADNGGCHEGRKGNDPNLAPGPKETFMSYGKAWANASNTPFRRYKTEVHEGGISTPLIARWPGRIQPNSLCREVGHIIDIVPTCLDAAGVAAPRELAGRERLPLEGKSMLPALKGRRRDGHEKLFWEHTGNRAVREGRWKLVAGRQAPWELYDMEADRSELNDLARTHPDRVERLAAAYDTWAQRCGVVPFHELSPKKKKNIRT